MYESARDDMITNQADKRKQIRKQISASKSKNIFLHKFRKNLLRYNITLSRRREFPRYPSSPENTQHAANYIKCQYPN